MAQRQPDRVPPAVRGADAAPPAAGARRATSLSPPERFLLEAWARSLHDAFGDVPYLVGSVARAESWRDVDVRLMLNDDAYDALIGTGRSVKARLAVLNVSISVWGQRATGLPIDFQFQPMTAANRDHNGPRVPVGIHSVETDR